jgi:thiol-disulfide isomerase/thioredoxin
LFVAFEARAVDSLLLEDLGGTAVELAPAAGGALVIHFWATWCPSCKHELGALDRAARSCDAARVAVVAVDVGEQPETVREYLAESPLALRVLLDRSGRTWRKGGGREMPANWIWTPASRSWTFGPSSEADWRARFTALGCVSSDAAPPPQAIPAEPH